MLARRDPDRAGRLVTEFRQGFDLGIDLLEAGTDRDDETLARLGWRDTARATGQKTQAHASLHPADGMAER